MRQGRNEKDNQKNLETNETQNNKTYGMNAVKAVLRGMFIAINAYTIDP